MELGELLERFGNVRTLRGQRAVVRNGYLPEREVLTAAGPIAVKVPKVRDRSGSGDGAHVVQQVAAEHRPDQRTPGGCRRYDLARLCPRRLRGPVVERRTVAYARVSLHDQKADLERQKQVLELYCAQQGWTFEVVADLGSGMNYQKKGLKRLLSAVIGGQVGRLVITHKDRLLQFGAELVFAICEAKQVEVVIQGEDTTFEEDLAKDVLEIITVFSARLYGSRSRKNQKILDDVRRTVEAARC